MISLGLVLHTPQVNCCKRLKFKMFKVLLDNVAISFTQDAPWEILIKQKVHDLSSVLGIYGNHLKWGIILFSNQVSGFFNINSNIKASISFTSTCWGNNLLTALFRSFSLSWLWKRNTCFSLMLRKSYIRKIYIICIHPYTSIWYKYYERLTSGTANMRDSDIQVDSW